MKFYSIDSGDKMCYRIFYDPNKGFGLLLNPSLTDGGCVWLCFQSIVPGLLFQTDEFIPLSF